MDERITLRVPCLVLDHDDTTVNSTATVHYPCFVEYMQKYFPNVHLTLEEYFNANFDPGVVKLFTEICGMTVDQIEGYLLGNTCGGRPTSCADQLAKEVREGFEKSKE